MWNTSSTICSVAGVKGSSLSLSPSLPVNSSHCSWLSCSRKCSFITALLRAIWGLPMGVEAKLVEDVLVYLLWPCLPPLHSLTLSPFTLLFLHCAPRSIPLTVPRTHQHFRSIFRTSPLRYVHPGLLPQQFPVHLWAWCLSPPTRSSVRGFIWFCVLLDPMCRNGTQHDGLVNTIGQMIE